MSGPRPLDRLTSIKVKLGVVVLGSVAATTASLVFGWRTGLKWELRLVLTALVFVAVTQVLAHGMTLPLRQMAAAARRMAAGDLDAASSVTATSRDEVGELARAFKAMAEEVAALDRQRRDLLADVGHELRTPLAAVQARLENLVDGVEPPDPEVLGAMLRSTERLGRLVEQLLDLSRLESGAAPLHRRAVPLGEVLEGAAEEARLSAPAADLRVSVAGDAVAMADPERLHQVVANLVENAVRHSPAGAPIELSASGPRAGVVALEVADLGPGIPPEEAERVFHRFHRVERSRAGGAGLGLAIARSIVERHGGAIAALPNRPAGCRVRVELPAAPAA